MLFVVFAANLSGPTSGSNSGLPTPSGRGTGRLVGLIGRENTGISN